VGAFGELGKDTNKGGMLYVFALDSAPKQVAQK
jgi:hypothetical protein